jgi:hypothetical protein
VLAAVLEGAAAEHVRSEHDGCLPVVAQVVEVQAEYGLVTLRVGGAS